MDASQYKDLQISPRVLLGPGPSMVEGRVLRAMATPVTATWTPIIYR